MIAQITVPQDHWLLEGISEDELRPVLDAGREVRFVPGEVIFREGDVSDGLYLILAGYVQITAEGGSGEGFLAIAKANEVVGEMGVLDGAPRSGTAKAASMCVTYFIPMDPFLDLLERSSMVCMRLLVLLTARLRAADHLLVDVDRTEEIELL